MPVNTYFLSKVSTFLPWVNCIIGASRDPDFNAEMVKEKCDGVADCLVPRCIKKEELFSSGGQAGPNGLVHRKVEDLIYNKVNGQDNLFEVKFNLPKPYFIV